ncbi:MAG: response regulator [marine benthic group bacterium]|nr:response regulator [Gemmatimonadota bacterium]
MSGIVARLGAFVREARRRKVWVTAVAYAALTVGLIEISGAVSEALLFPDWTSRLVTFLLLLGFPIVVVMAWIFDFEAGGLRRTEALEPAVEQPSRPIPAAGTPSLSGQRRSGFVSAPPVPEPAAPRRRAPNESPLTVEPAPPDPDRLKRAALGHVRHELRTPINAILGYSEMLLEDEDDPEVSADLKRVNESGRRLLGVVDSILNPTRLEGAIDRELESFAAEIEADLRTPINAVVGYCEMLLESQQEIGRDILVPDLEKILVAARTLLATSADIVQVATQAPGLEDAGLPNRLLDSSELTRGVLAKLPTSELRQEQGALGQGSLLVVDDNPTNRDLLTRQLARQGYIVAAAADGQEALNRLAEQEFDLVLLDVIMPGMDGVETLLRLKSDDRLAAIPVIMLSSLDEVDSAIRCIEAGAEEFITKPVQPKLLEARIAANLEVRSLRERERALRARIEADSETIDRLLRSTFPTGIAERIRGGETGIVEPIARATVLVCLPDGRGFGTGNRLSNDIGRLAGWFEIFDTLCREHGAYLCSGGRHGFLAAANRPEGSAGDEDAVTMADLAITFRDTLQSQTDESGPPFRFGLHSGPALGAVIGRDRLRFDLWGESVDTARHLASSAEPGTVIVSPGASALLKDRYRLDPGRVTEIHGLGQMRPFILQDRLERGGADA